MFARTERLTLRPAWPEDVPALKAIGKDGYTRLLTEGKTAPKFGDGAAPEPSFVIEAHEVASTTLIGTIGLSSYTGAADLAFWLIPAARGHGYATEAARAVVEIARHSLPITRLQARRCASDESSARVLAKLGFRALQDGVLSGGSSLDGTDLLYGLDVVSLSSPLSSK